MNCTEIELPVFAAAKKVLDSLAPPPFLNSPVMSLSMTMVPSHFLLSDPGTHQAHSIPAHFCLRALPYRTFSFPDAHMTCPA